MAPQIRSSNRLLASLPRDEYELVAAGLHPVSIRPGVALSRRGRPIRHVYFPSEGAFSLEKISDTAQPIEIALVGAEGLIGAEVFYGATASSVDCRPLVSAVRLHAMEAELFRRHLERRGAFYNVVVRYQQALMSQIVQTTACTALHTAEQRTCRWLLMVQDRAMTEVIPVSQKRLAEMLGIGGRAAVRTAGALANRGGIVLRQGGFAISDRAQIESASCECYQTMRRSFQRLLPEIGALTGTAVSPKVRA